MRKLLILLVIALGFMLSVVSCSKTEEQLPLFNFGSSIYDEPFVGLLKSKPSLLTKSIQYPPFSWVTSDTICLEKTLEITFNEECVRSKSEAIIQFRDSLYKPINGVRIYCNGEIAENGDFTIVADSLVKALTIKCMISPSVGDSIIHGIILIQGKELDVVNGETLQQDNNVIANWECEQEIGWPVLLWLLWLVVFIGALLAIFYIFIGIVKLLSIFKIYLNSVLTQNDRVKTKKHKKPNKELIRLSNILMSDDSNFSDRAIALEKILQILDSLNMEEKEREFQLRPKKIQNALDILWSKHNNNYPKSGGHWSGEVANSLWIPDDNIIPRNRGSHNNNFGKNWKELKKQYKIKGVRFKNGFIDLSDIAVARVEIDYTATTYDRYTKYGKLGIHDTAFIELAKVWKCSVEDARKKKEQNIWMWHEDIDCKTILLVPQEIHGNVEHFGGIGMAKIINDTIM